MDTSNPTLSGPADGAAANGGGPTDREKRDAAAATRREIVPLLPELRGFARMLVRDRTAADDLVQDTVLRALGALEQFQRGTNLKAWLFTIQRNTFYEQVRRRGRERAAMQRHVEQDEAERPVQLARSDVADLQLLLWQLPELLREALVLVGAQELSYEEAATVCNVPVGTMKARVSRARAALVKAGSGPQGGVIETTTG